jgi:cell division protein FtsW (lipid II flippase)
VNPWLASQCQRIARLHPGLLTLAVALALTGIGILAIATVEPGYAARQGKLWLPAALVVAAICTLPRPRTIGWLAYPAFFGVLGLLAFLVAPGVPRWLVPVRNGATSWIDLGAMNVQPSEVAKIVFVLALAWYLRYRNSYRTLPGLLVPFVFMGLPVGLILLQPDLGTAMVFGPTLFAMLIAAGAKLRHIGALLGMAAIVVVLVVATVWIDPPHDKNRIEAIHVLQKHQEERIASMLWPEKYKDDEAYQQNTVKRLVSAGGAAGYGRERAQVILKYNRLPLDHNDMIFAVIINRWGFGGAVAVTLSYLLLLLSFVLVAARAKEPFTRLAVVGLAAMIFTQAAINMAVTVGLLPVTGITLPFVSYGGSSLVATYIMVGLAINFASRRPAPLTRPSFEFDEPEPAAPLRRSATPRR